MMGNIMALERFVPDMIAAYAAIGAAAIAILIVRQLLFKFARQAAQTELQSREGDETNCSVPIVIVPNNFVQAQVVSSLDGYFSSFSSAIYSDSSELRKLFDEAFLEKLASDKKLSTIISVQRGMLTEDNSDSFRREIFNWYEQNRSDVIRGSMDKYIELKLARNLHYVRKLIVSMARFLVRLGILERLLEEVTHKEKTRIKTHLVRELPPPRITGR